MAGGSALPNRDWRRPRPSRAPNLRSVSPPASSTSAISINTAFNRHRSWHHLSTIIALRLPAPLDVKIVVSKVRRRLIPFVFLLYIVAYLDRINVGFAALQMNAALGLSASEFGLGAGIFFVSYTLLEVPSNVVLARIGARLWIARIMITWGLVSSGMMFVQGPSSFYVMRFLLGAAEAGFFPGIIFYLTQWV